MNFEKIIDFSDFKRIQQVCLMYQKWNTIMFSLTFSELTDLSALFEFLKFSAYNGAFDLCF